MLNVDQLAELVSKQDVGNKIGIVATSILCGGSTHDAVNILKAINVLVSGVLADHHTERENYNQYQLCMKTLNKIYDLSVDMMNEKDTKEMIDSFKKVVND